MTFGENFHSDMAAYRDSWVSRIDPRTKLFFTIAYLFVSVASVHIYLPLTVGLVSLVALRLAGVRLRDIRHQLVIAFFLAGAILVIDVFLTGHTPLFTIHLFGRDFSGFREGLDLGLIVVARVIGGILLMLVLGMTTPIPNLLFAASWFRMPKLLVEVIMLTYRYIFVILEEAVRLRDAQEIRLGFSSWKRAIHSAGTVAGGIIIRAYDRAEQSFTAMSLRGYAGNWMTPVSLPWGRQQVIELILLSAILILMIVIG